MNIKCNVSWKNSVICAEKQIKRLKKKKKELISSVKIFFKHLFSTSVSMDQAGGCRKVKRLKCKLPNRRGLLFLWHHWSPSPKRSVTKQPLPLYLEAFHLEGGRVPNRSSGRINVVFMQINVLLTGSRCGGEGRARGTKAVDF